MAGYDETLAQARRLTAEEQRRLARELGGGAPLAQLGTLAMRPAAPQSAAWIKSERGHAVLATDTGPAEADIPAGADAIAGMWSDMRGAQGEQG